MKFLFVTLALLVFQSASNAVDLSKPYSEMTYAELQQVDKNTLDKTDKRAFKTAFKAAQKAWSKAEKARKKAVRKAEKALRKSEKNRLKAERKRLKAEAKARKKHNKFINKQLALINNAYKHTSVENDEFEGYIVISAPIYAQSSTIFDPPVRERKEWSQLRAYFFPETNNIGLELYVSKRLTVTDLDKDSIADLHSSPENYVRREGYWKNYNRAMLAGGIKRGFISEEKYLSKCSSYCAFREDYIVKLEFDDLKDALSNLSHFEVKISNSKLEAFIVSVPSAHLVGFLKRMSEVAPALAPMNAPARLIEQRFRDGLIPEPSR